MCERERESVCALLIDEKGMERREEGDLERVEVREGVRVEVCWIDIR